MVPIGAQGFRVWMDINNMGVGRDRGLGWGGMGLGVGEGWGGFVS